MTDLLPCPFCGSSKIDAEGWSSTDSRGPACDDCGASAGCVSKSPSQNIAAWNTRATPQPTRTVLPGFARARTTDNDAGPFVAAGDTGYDE